MKRVAGIVSPEDQKVTFVELFFDLVFVFSVTQVVQVLHGGFDWLHVGRAVLIFWLVWWAWTQFTWALNAADTTHPLIEFGVLVATALAFFMAVAVPDAFGDSALWFALPYVVVRAFGLGLYGLVALQDPTQYAAVCRFAVASAGGLAAVIIGGIAGGSLQYWFWGLAILLDVVAAAIGGQSEGWNLHPEHFAERHGLFVIIALGESLIVAAGGLTGQAWNAELLAVAVLTVAVTCGLWWTYFTRAKPLLDHALESSKGTAQSMMARDAFSLIHFPIVCGIVAYAAAIEELLAHPAEATTFPLRLAVAVGTMLFLGGMAAAVWRCTRRVLASRLLATGAATVAVVMIPEGSPVLILTILLAGVAATGYLELKRGPFEHRAEAGHVAH